MREQSNPQSDALLISLIVNQDQNIKELNLSKEEKSRLTDDILYGRAEEALLLYTPDGSLKLKLRDYGLWKETIGKEEQESVSTQESLEDAAGIASEKSEDEKIEDLGKLRRKVFNQTMDLISTVLERLDITTETFNEWAEEIGQAVIDSISQMDKGTLEERSTNIAQASELPDDQQKSLVSSLLGDNQWSRLEKSMGIHQDVMGLVSKLFADLDDTDGSVTKMRKEISSEVKGKISEMDANALAEAQENARNALAQQQEFFLSGLLGHKRWKESREPSTVENPQVATTLPDSLGGMDVSSIQNLPGLGDVTCSSLDQSKQAHPEKPDNTPVVEKEEEIGNNRGNNSSGISGP